MQRTVLLLGPLPHTSDSDGGISNRNRVALLSSYESFFAGLVFVFIPAQPRGESAVDFCDTDYLTCKHWPNRELCWVDTIRQIQSLAPSTTAPKLRLRLMQSRRAGAGAGIAGILYAHADLWINPFTIVDGLWPPHSENAFWFPRHRCWGAFAESTLSSRSKVAVSAGLSSAKAWFAKKQPSNRLNIPRGTGCRGWADVAYLPLVGLADFQRLLGFLVSAGSFHEVAVPTAQSVLNSYRRYGVS